jgi:hypothetical protein
VRRDNRLVFQGRRFRAACRDYGLRQEFIRPYTPQNTHPRLVRRLARSGDLTRLPVADAAPVSPHRTSPTRVGTHSRRCALRTISDCSASSFDDRTVPGGRKAGWLETCFTS